MKNSLTILGLFAAVAAAGCSTTDVTSVHSAEMAQLRFDLAQKRSIGDKWNNPDPVWGCELLRLSLESMVGANLTFEEAGISEKKFHMVKELNGCKFN